MANRFIVLPAGATAKATWDAYNTAIWSTATGGATGATVPIQTDDVVLDANSGTGTVTVSNNGANGATGQVCHNITCTGFTGTLVISGITLTISGTDVNIASITANASTITFTNTSQARLLIGSGSLYNLTIATAIVSLLSNLTVSNTFTLTKGLFTANGFDVSAKTFSSSNTNSRGFNMTGGRLTLTGNGTVWNCATSTNMVIAGMSIIILNDATANIKTFAGGGLTYYDIWLTGTGTGAFNFTGSNTFNNFKCDTPPHTIGFTGGTTTTVRAWLVSGTSGNPITITGIAGGAYAIDLLGGGTTSSDWLDIDHMTGTPVSTWYAGSHSTDNGNNHNLSFTDNPNPPRATLNRYGVTFLDGTNQMSAAA